MSTHLNTANCIFTFLSAAAARQHRLSFQGSLLSSEIASSSFCYTGYSHSASLLVAAALSSVYPHSHLHTTNCTHLHIPCALSFPCMACTRYLQTHIAHIIIPRCNRAKPSEPFFLRFLCMAASFRIRRHRRLRCALATMCTFTVHLLQQHVRNQMIFPGFLFQRLQL